MFKAILLATVLPILSALADPVPDAPAPGDSFNEGSTCHIGWTADTTGTWKTMNIELMTGDNFNMVQLTSEWHSVRVFLLLYFLEGEGGGQSFGSALRRIASLT